jgi:hypothetical protein
MSPEEVIYQSTFPPWLPITATSTQMSEDDDDDDNDDDDDHDDVGPEQPT